MKRPKSAPQPADSTDAKGAKRERGAITVYSALREDILTLRLEPGSAVDEVEIADQFGLSRTPVREALFLLSGEGLVRVLPNRSSIISPLTMANMNDYMDTLLILTRAVMASAAARCRDGDLDLLRGHLAAFRDAIATTEVEQIVFRQLDLLKGFAAVGRNYFLNMFFPDCLDYGRRTMLLHYYPYLGPDELTLAAADYDALIDAVGAGDAEACNAIVGRQLGRVVRVIQTSFEPRVADTVDISTRGFPRPRP